MHRGGADSRVCVCLASASQQAAASQSGQDFAAEVADRCVSALRTLAGDLKAYSRKWTAPACLRRIATYGLQAEGCSYLGVYVSVKMGRVEHADGPEAEPDPAPPPPGPAAGAVEAAGEQGRDYAAALQAVVGNALVARVSRAACVVSLLAVAPNQREAVKKAFLRQLPFERRARQRNCLNALAFVCRLHPVVLSAPSSRLLVSGTCARARTHAHCHTYRRQETHGGDCSTARFCGLCG